MLRESIARFCDGIEASPDTDAAGVMSKSFARTLRGLLDRDTPGPETSKFVSWWKDDKDRRLCTLEQAIGAYVSTFPGRLHFLLVELLEPVR